MHALADTCAGAASTASALAACEAGDPSAAGCNPVDYKMRNGDEAAWALMLRAQGWLPKVTALPELAVCTWRQLSHPFCAVQIPGGDLCGVITETDKLSRVSSGADIWSSTVAVRADAG